MGSNWLGSNWFGSNWFGSNWLDGGGSAGGGTPVYAMRVDRPLADVDVAPHNLTATFPKRAWDADLVALTIMPEFLDQRDAQGRDWKAAVVAALPGPTSPITLAMVQDMIMKAVTERPEALGEIVQEHNNFQVRYLQLLGMTGHSHPYTFLLMKFAARVGEFTMISLKRLETPWNLRSRPRPSQVCPTLFPALPVPGHSTYPAGHALIAWLTTEVLKDISSLQASAYTKSLDALAERISSNRVFAGLHFQEDVDHGKLAGIEIHKFIKQCPSFKDALAEARKEWI